MKSNALKKIDDFAKRHLFLSSFVCLFILGIIINFYWAFDRRESSYTFVGIAEYINMVKWSIFLTFLIGSIPIFFISLLLYSFLRKKSAIDIRLAFYQKFLLSLIAALVIILLFFSWIAVLFPHKMSDFNHSLFFFFFIYSVIFSAFFGWFTNSSKMRIIIQCIVVNILMAFLFIIEGILHNWSF